VAGLGKTVDLGAPRTRAERPNEVSLKGEDSRMGKPILRNHSQDIQPDASRARQSNAPDADGRRADMEMARVLGTTPFRMALDPTGAGR
jgi:hypothetical protein